MPVRRPCGEDPVPNGVAAAEGYRAAGDGPTPAGRRDGLTTPARRGAGRVEVPDIDAFRTADPHPVGERLMDVAEEGVARPGGADGVQQGGAAPLEAAGDGVVAELGDVRRDVGAQHVHLAERLDLGGVLLVADLVGRPHRGGQPAADEPEDPAADLHPLAVEDGGAGPGVLGPEPRHVDVAEGGVGRGGEGGEEVGVLAADRGLDDLLPAGAARVQLGPEPAAQRAGLVEAAGGAQCDQGVGVGGAEEVGEDAARVVRVVEEEDQVAEADQGVGPVPGRRQVPTVAMDVTDHMHAHGVTLDRVGRRREAGAGPAVTFGSPLGWSSLRVQSP